MRIAGLDVRDDAGTVSLSTGGGIVVPDALEARREHQRRAEVRVARAVGRTALDAATPAPGLLGGHQVRAEGLGPQGRALADAPPAPQTGVTIVVEVS